VIKKYISGIDDKGNKSTIAYDIFNKKWNVVNKESKNKIYMVPAENLIYFTEKSNIENYADLLNYYNLLIEEKYPSHIYDIHVEKSENKYTVHIMVLKDFSVPKDYYALDGEIFTLKRALKVNGEDTGYIFNFKKDNVTVVFIKDGNLVYYRVVKFFEDIKNLLEQLPYVEEEKPLLIFGDVDTSFKKLLSENLKSSKLIESKYNLPTIVALKAIFEPNFLSFKKSEITKEELEKIKISALILVLIYAGIYFSSSYFIEKAVKKAKIIETAIFKSAFPNVPAVSPYEQLKAQVKTSLTYELSKLLSEVDLPRDSKIYSIEYVNGVLTVKGESNEPPNLAKYIKKTPTGSFEFEIEVKK
jgi:hypothetical protein